MLDTGCGEGYYTSGVYRALVRAGRSVTMAGTDISKAILRRAAKREKDVEFAVASSYHLPVADGAVDLLVNCFSPWPSRSSAGCCRRGRFRVCGAVGEAPVGAEAGAV